MSEQQIDVDAEMPLAEEEIIITEQSKGTKNKKGKPIRSGQKLMAYNVYLKNAKDESKTIAVKQTSHEVGIGERMMWNIVKEIESTGSARSPRKKRYCTTKYDHLEDFEKAAIRRHVHTFFFKNELPTLQKVLSAVNNDDSLPNFKRTTLWKILKKLGFRYEKRSRKTALIERKDIVLWRRKYLTSIKEFREEGRTIYYLDETWVNAGHIKNKVWKDTTIKTGRQALLEGLSTGIKNPSGKGTRLIVVHMGSNSGFVEGAFLNFQSKKTGDYHEYMNGSVFKDWLDSVLPSLDQNSVIVMDNAPYHSIKSEKIPTQSWKKQDIITWLKNKGIPNVNEMLKVQLLELVKSYSLSHPTPYVIDEMVQNSGRTILRLPPYHCNLNPIKLIWAQVKHYVAANNTTYKIADVKRLLQEGINGITKEQWQNCETHTLEEENRMWDLDGITENMIELIINVNSESSSTEDSSEEYE